MIDENGRPVSGASVVLRLGVAPVGSSVCPSHLTLLTNDGEIDNELGADNPLTDVHNLSMGIRFWLRNFLLLLAVCGLLTTACLGGNGGHSTTYGTWSWDGSRWTQLAVTNQGKTLIADRLFYSTALGGLIDMNGTMWNGSSWVKSDSVPTPAPVGDGNQETSYVLDEATGELTEAHLKNEYELVSLLIGVNNQYQGKPVDRYVIEFEDLLKTAIRLAGGSVLKLGRRCIRPVRAPSIARDGEWF